MVTRLPDDELARRASRLRLVLTDVDGVLTDGGVYYSEKGEELKRFDVRDGMGMELLREAGVSSGIITREDSPCVAARARKLRLEHVYLGVFRKEDALPEILARAGLAIGQVAYIGDDVNDLAILRDVAREGVTGAPADATASIAEIAHVHVARPGGRGAFREFADILLAYRGRGMAEVDGSEEPREEPAWTRSLL